MRLEHSSLARLMLGLEDCPEAHLRLRRACAAPSPRVPLFLCPTLWPQAASLASSSLLLASRWQSCRLPAVMGLIRLEGDLGLII